MGQPVGSIGRGFLALAFVPLIAACQLVLGFEEHVLLTGGGSPSGGGGGAAVGCQGAEEGATCTDGDAPSNGQCKGGVCVDCVDELGCEVGAVCLADDTCCTPQNQLAACAGKTCGEASDSCGGTQGCGNCEEPAAICSAAQQCVECLSDADCDDTPNTPNCDAATGRCEECVVDGDCLPAAPVCEPGSKVCVECSADSDCVGDLAGHHCTPGFTCGCANASDCDDSTFGSQCLASDVCGCSQPSHCNGNLAGPTCTGAVCGP